jgi:hypothetical protein
MLLAPLALLALGFEPTPLPLLEEREYLRPSLELVSSLGAGVPAVRHGDASLPAGSEIGVHGLYRATPYFAFGPGLRVNAFPFLPGRETGGSAIFAAVCGRLYFQERGADDPYFELALGLSSLKTSRGGGALRSRDESGLSPTARAAIGIDFSVGRRARLGPSVGYTRYAGGSIERCTAHGCASFPAEQSDLPESLLSFGISLTFGAGDPL